MGWCLGWLVFGLHLDIQTWNLFPNSEAFIYSATTGHPAFSSFSTYVSPVFSFPFLPTPGLKPDADSSFLPLSTLGAKSIATTVLGICFAARVIHTHWLTPGLPAPKLVKVGSAGKKSKKKAE